MTTLEFCGLRLAHPIVNGSGTFDAIAARRAFGDALLERFPFAAFVSKTITLAPRDGNPPPRLWETPAGLINSIGLPNKGLRGYLDHDLPELARLPVPLIDQRHGLDGRRAVRRWSRRSTRATRSTRSSSTSPVRTSRPGSTSAPTPVELAAVLAEVRPRTAKPLIVKLTPNTADVAAVAQAAQEAGADAVSLINTLRAYAPHPRIGSHPPAAWLGNGTGGLSGPAIRAVALAQVRAVAARVSIPVVGMGGVQSGLHAAHMLEAGATLVAVGTESFRDPAAGTRISRELDDLFAKSADNLG